MRLVETVLQREVETAADIRRGDALAGMVRYLAATTGQELVLATMAERLGVDRATAQIYEPWLEVDLILESDDGRVVAVEVKATSTPRADDFRWLGRVRDQLDRAGGDFRCGVVLHTGTSRLTFGDRMVALPIADLWT